MLIPPAAVTKILFINLAHIGDIVLSFPVVKALKAAYPQASIDMLVSSPYGEVAYYNPYVNKVFFYMVRSWKQDRVTLQKIIKLLFEQKYDLAIASCYGTADPMMALFTGAKYRAGFVENGGGKYLTLLAPVSAQPLHELEHQLQVLAALDIAVNDTAIEYAIPAATTASLYAKIPSLQDTTCPHVILCPFSRDIQKNWTIAATAETLTQLSKRAICYLIGTAQQAADLEQINKAAGTAATVLGGCLSLGELGALIRAASLLITVDTGPLHIANAFNTPVVALFGPTNPIRWGPRKPQDVILQAGISCSPCGDVPSIKEHCLTPSCMSLIQPAAVIAAAAKWL